jgi:hypothetical protein
LPRGLRQALSQPSPTIRERITELRAAAPDPAHVEVSQVPWALVLSSAIDTRLATALEAAAPEARRVRRRFVDEVNSEILVRSPTVLEVMHLSLISRTDSLDGAIAQPTSWTRLSFDEGAVDLSASTAIIP